MNGENLTERLDRLQAELDEAHPARGALLREFREEHGRVLLALDAAREWQAGARGAAVVARPPREGAHTEEAYSEHKARYMAAALGGAYADGADIVAEVDLRRRSAEQERDDTIARAEKAEARVLTEIELGRACTEEQLLRAVEAENEVERLKARVIELEDNLSIVTGEHREARAYAERLREAQRCVSCGRLICPPMQCGECIEKEEPVPGMPFRPATATLRAEVERLRHSLADIASAGTSMPPAVNDEASHYRSLAMALIRGATAALAENG